MGDWEEIFSAPRAKTAFVRKLRSCENCVRAKTAFVRNPGQCGLDCLSVFGRGVKILTLTALCVSPRL